MNQPDDELGKLLVDEQFITQRQLGRAVSYAEQTSQSLHKVFVSLGFVTERELVELTGRQLGIPFVDLDSTQLIADVVALLPEDLVMRYQAIPIDQHGDKLRVAMLYPRNAVVLDDIRLITGFSPEPVMVTESAMASALKRMFGSQDPEVGRDLDGASSDGEIWLNKLKEMVDEAPIVRVVNLIISQAINDHAAAIHIEKGLVRYRVDGVLYEVMNPPEHIHDPVVARIKVMSNMDIAERRIPQDGIVRLTHDGTDYTLRVSCLPCEGGEKIIFRMVPCELALQPEIGNLGLSSQNQASLESLLKRRAGLLVVSGGRRSGKATTLYSCLRTIQQAQKCIYSVTDPYQWKMALPWVNHIPLNRKAGLILESAIASCLRSDPDVLLIGSVSSVREAWLAADAACQGCLVLASTHASSAAGGLVKLVDLGLEPYLLSQTLLGTLNQRLARRICPDCQKSIPAPPDMNAAVIRVGEGCQKCRSSGCRGLIGVHELLHNSPPVADMLLTKAPAKQLHDLACRLGMVPMREDALDKVCQGLISLHEMLRTLRD